MSDLKFVMGKIAEELLSKRISQKQYKEDNDLEKSLKIWEDIAIKDKKDKRNKTINDILEE
jgi:hypothetical protein